MRGGRQDHKETDSKRPGGVVVARPASSSEVSGSESDNKGYGGVNTTAAR